MKLEGIKAILFGWDGILDLRRFKGVGGVEEKIAYYAGGLNSADLKVLHGRADDYAKGTMPSEEFWKFVGNYFNLKRPVVDDFKSYYVNVDELNKPLWAALPYLAKRYRLGILADCPPDKTKVIYEKGGLDVFRGRTYFSSEHHWTKKDRAFFELALRGLDVKAEKCLLVDGSVIDANNAMNFGLRVHLYKDNAGFLRAVNGRH